MQVFLIKFDDQLYQKLLKGQDKYLKVEGIFLKHHLMEFIYLNLSVMLVPLLYMMTSYREVVV